MKFGNILFVVSIIISIWVLVAAVPTSTGEINETFSYLNHPKYWFGKTRQTGNAMEGGDTNYDGTYSSSDNDGVVYLYAGGGSIHDSFKDYITIKLFTLALTDEGKPIENKTITEKIVLLRG